ncbi:MAG: DUF721 domain-containing protein [Verrucomicrobia bacterium]|nr:DUF721 domain-containing protein [Verrucomicrobiota bacterium]MDA1067522.1 DUF721 domain-containing protein [Verrucomicrobiota bacterium]
MPKSSNFSRKTNNLIASLRGLPRDKSRAFWKDEKDLDSVMDRVIQKFQITESRPEEAILADWTSIVGDRNASHSHPHRLDHGFRLYVLVNNPVVKQEMQFHKKMILARLTNIPGCEGIREIIFRAG